MAGSPAALDATKGRQHVPEHLVRGFAVRLTRAVDAYGTEHMAIARILNVSKQTLSNWMCGYCFPGIKHLIPLSALLGVSIDYLLTGKEWRRIT